MGFLEWYMLAIICLVLPYLSIRSWRKLAKSDKPIPSKMRAWLTSIAFLAIMGWLAWLVAQEHAMPILPTWHPSSWEFTLGAIFLLVGLTIRTLLLPWLLRGRNRLTGKLAPTKLSELPLWTLVSASAGIFEELIYRGVVYQLLFEVSGSITVAILISSIAFALAHISQGPQAAVFIFCVALSMHAMVLWTGTLYMAMIVHATYDFGAGVQNILKPAPIAASAESPN